MGIHAMADYRGERAGLPTPFGAIDLAFDVASPDSTECQRFLSCWQSRHGERDHGRTVEPAEIIPLLPHTYLIERTGQGWRYKLFGSALVDQLDLDLTGRLVADVFVPTASDALAHLFHGVAWRRAPIGVVGRWWSGNADLCFEGIQAPLAGPDRPASLLLGCMVFRPPLIVL